MIFVRSLELHDVETLEARDIQRRELHPCATSLPAGQLLHKALQRLIRHRVLRRVSEERRQPSELACLQEEFTSVEASVDVVRVGGESAA